MIPPKLILVAMDAGHDAVADDAKPFTCSKCSEPLEDEEMIQCQGCRKTFCQDCVITDEETSLEFCHACAKEGRAIQDTYDTLGRPD